MSPRNPFGWHYPPGAANDPNAPWNEPDAPQCPQCGDDLIEEIYTDGSAEYRCPECHYSYVEHSGDILDEPF